MKSPLTLLGLLVLAVGILQLVPLPPRLARRISPGVAANLQLRGLAGAGAMPTIPRPWWASRPRSARRRRSIGPRPCDGWSGRRVVWGSSGSSRISRIACGGCTWSGEVSWRRFCSTVRSDWCRSPASRKGCSASFLPGRARVVGAVARRSAGGADDHDLATSGRFHERDECQHDARENCPGPRPSVLVRNHDGRFRCVPALWLAGVAALVGDRAPCDFPARESRELLLPACATRDKEAWLSC